MAVPSGSLTTLDTVKEELAIDSSDYDAYLERLIGAATAQAENYCNRKFSFDYGIVEYVAGYATPHLMISRPPISDISEIRYDGSLVSGDAYEVPNMGNDTTGIIYGLNGWIWSAPGGSGITHIPKPATERLLYKVTYDGGYVTPQQEIDTVNDQVPLIRSLPYDLEDAIVQLVTHRFRSRGRDQTIASESLLQSSVSYKATSRSGTASLDEQLPDVAHILRSYLRPIML